LMYWNYLLIYWNYWDVLQ